MASVQNMVDAAANVALNAVLNVNAAVDGGAQGPYVFTVMRPPPMQLVRVFSYDFRDFDVPGIGGLSFLTAARPFFDALINSHLASMWRSRWFSTPMMSMMCRVSITS